MSTIIHCDSLVVAETGVKDNFATGYKANRDVYDFLTSEVNMALDFGRQAVVLCFR